MTIISKDAWDDLPNNVIARDEIPNFLKKTIEQGTNVYLTDESGSKIGKFAIENDKLVITEACK
jgi:hypothetical protein